MNKKAIIVLVIPALCLIGGFIMKALQLGSLTPDILQGLGELGILGWVAFHHGILKGIQKDIDYIKRKLP